jgi:hypothetical protein
VLGVDGPRAFGQHDSRVKMHNLCWVLKNYYNSRAHGHERPGKLTE